MASHHTSSSPGRTLKRIACSQIRAGMFLVRILDSWWKSPFFIHRRLLRPQDVQLLGQAGIHEVEIDISKGLDVARDSEEMLVHEVPIATEYDNDREESGRQEIRSPAPGSLSLEQGRHAQLIQLRADAVTALEHVFEGVKTGQALPLSSLRATANHLVHHALAHPTVFAEIFLLGHLEQFDRTLYLHVVDTAVLAILVGLQLGWDLEVLEEVAVAALLHDVGYMRLPLNLVQARWSKTGLEGALLQQHVDIGLALIHRKSQCSPEIVKLIREHHAYQDGSGYPRVHGGEPVSAPGKLLGLADYFDELLGEGNPAGSFPAALAIRRIYQEAQKGKFPTLFVEALIRVLGVYPVGTVVELSTGEQAVVVKQSAEISVKPTVKIIQEPNGGIPKVPEVRNLTLAASSGHEVNIEKVLASGNAARYLRELFS